MFIVSKCLLGEKTKYNGGDNRSADVVKFCESHSYISVCPESLYLETPREPSEIIRDDNGSFAVIMNSGRDVSREFHDGARDSIIYAESEAVRTGQPIEGAVLKARSPSCGFGEIYDGSFRHHLTEGNGIFAGMLYEEYRRFLNDGILMVEGASFSESFAIVNEDTLYYLTEKNE